MGQVAFSSRSGAPTLLGRAAAGREGGRKGFVMETSESERPETHIQAGGE